MAKRVQANHEVTTDESGSEAEFLINEQERALDNGTDGVDDESSADGADQKPDTELLPTDDDKQETIQPSQPPDGDGQDDVLCQVTLTGAASYMGSGVHFRSKGEEQSVSVSVANKLLSTGLFE